MTSMLITTMIIVTVTWTVAFIKLFSELFSWSSKRKVKKLRKIKFPY